MTVTVAALCDMAIDTVAARCKLRPERQEDVSTDPANQDSKPRLPKWVDLSIQSLLDAAPDAMLAVNREGRIVVANVQAEQLFGYARKQLIGKSVEELMPPRFRGQHQDHRERFF